MTDEWPDRRVFGWFSASIAAIWFWISSIITSGACGSQQRVHGTAARVLMLLAFGVVVIAIPGGVAVAERSRKTLGQIAGLSVVVVLAVVAFGFLLGTSRIEWDCGTGPGG